MYIELHARSAFSFLEGASLPEELIAVCGQLGMPAMALLDTDGVYGAPRFHLAAQKAKLKAHIGAEVTCASLLPVILSGARASQREAVAESKNPYPRQSAEGTGIPRSARNNNSFRLPLLVSTRTGYQNLCRLITKMKLRAKKGEGAMMTGACRFVLLAVLMFADVAPGQTGLPGALSAPVPANR